MKDKKKFRIVVLGGICIAFILTAMLDNFNQQDDFIQQAQFTYEKIEHSISTGEPFHEDAVKWMGNAVKQQESDPASFTEEQHSVIDLLNSMMMDATSFILYKDANSLNSYEATKDDAYRKIFEE